MISASFFPHLEFNDTFYLLLWFHCLIGGIATLIARQKGYSLAKWTIIGLIGGTFAFVYALWLKKLEPQE